MSTSTGSGTTVKWQQISEDLVPVNIALVQESPEYIFHISAYNSQVDKILDVRLIQPGTNGCHTKSSLNVNANVSLCVIPAGTRIGQASECFVYWRDPMTNDTWGLNFTSPIDARQFKDCCVSRVRSDGNVFCRVPTQNHSIKKNVF